MSLRSSLGKVGKAVGEHEKKRVEEKYDVGKYGKKRSSGKKR